MGWNGIFQVEGTHNSHLADCGSAPACTSLPLLRCPAGLCSGTGCRRVSISRRHPPSVAFECLPAVGWNVACTGTRLPQPAPTPAPCPGCQEGSCARLTSAAPRDRIPCGKAGGGQRGDQRRFPLWCQHAPGVPWHRMLGCDTGTAHATSPGQLSPARRGQSTHSCCVGGSDGQAVLEGRGTLRPGTLLQTHRQGYRLQRTPDRRSVFKNTGGFFGL